MASPRASFAILIALVLTATMLAGCFTERGHETDAGTDVGPDKHHDGHDHDHDPPTSPEPTRPRPVPPAQQEVQSDDELDRPGEYVLLPDAPGADPEDGVPVPMWRTNHTWTYETWHVGLQFVPGCDAAGANPPRIQQTVTGEGRTQETDVYRVESVHYSCLGNETNRLQHNFTRDSITELLNDGYTEHSYVFPLYEGKRWMYIGENGQNVSVEVGRDREYRWAGQVVDAFKVVNTYDGEGNTTQTLWFGPDARNTLYREIRTDDWCHETGPDGACINEEKEQALIFSWTLVDHDVS